jgi:hypothetical protein
MIIEVIHWSSLVERLYYSWDSVSFQSAEWTEDNIFTLQGICALRKSKKDKIFLLCQSSGSFSRSVIFVNRSSNEFNRVFPHVLENYWSWKTLRRKGGSMYDLDNYRGITLTSNVCKVYAKIIEQFAMSYMEVMVIFVNRSSNEFNRVFPHVLEIHSEFHQYHKSFLT